MLMECMQRVKERRIKDNSKFLACTTRAPIYEMGKTIKGRGGEENQKFGFGNVQFEMPTRHLTQYTAKIQEGGNKGRGLG